MSPEQEKLLCFITHAPLFESCFPILEKLNERGRICVDLVVDSRLPRTDAGIAKALGDTLISFEYQHRARIELLSYFAIRNADAVLSHSDPLAYRKVTRPRDWYLPASGTPQIFLQHGLLQSGINWPSGELGLRWYSDLLLWWDDFNPVESSFIDDDFARKVKKVGFIKKAYVTEIPLPEAQKSFFASFRQRLIICTSFGDHLVREGEGTQEDFYLMCDQFCARNPDVLLVLRPHRGRQDAENMAKDQALVEKHSNVVIMDRYKGDFAYTSILGILGHCDAVVTHVSSVVLDAIYADTPVAILNNWWEKLDTLQNITNLESLESFSQAAPEIRAKDNKLFKLYGEIDENIERAAIEVETHMMKWREQG